MNKISGVAVYHEGRRYWFPNGPLFGFSIGHYADLMSRGAVEKVFYNVDEEEVATYRPEGFEFNERRFGQGICKVVETPLGEKFSR